MMIEIQFERQGPDTIEVSTTPKFASLSRLERHCLKQVPRNVNPILPHLGCERCPVLKATAEADYSSTPEDELSSPSVMALGPQITGESQNGFEVRCELLNKPYRPDEVKEAQTPCESLERVTQKLNHCNGINQGWYGKFPQKPLPLKEDERQPA